MTTYLPTSTTAGTIVIRQHVLHLYHLSQFHNNEFSSFELRVGIQEVVHRVLWVVGDEGGFGRLGSEGPVIGKRL